MADPRTINLPGSGTATQQYELAPGLIQYVQSVRVVVDNSGGADATPTLSISEQSGVVIADVPQNGVLPAGEADGAATWALRLTDDTRAAAGGTATIGFYDVPDTSVPSGTTTPLELDYNSGAALLDLTFPTRPVIIANGTYLLRATLQCATSGSDHPGKVGLMRLAIQHDYGTFERFVANAIPLNQTLQSTSMSVVMPWIVSTHTDFELAADQDTGVGYDFFGAVSVMKLG